MQGGQAHDKLQALGEEQFDADGGGHRQRGRDHPSEQAPVAEQREVDQRVGLAALSAYEHPARGCCDQQRDHERQRHRVGLGGFLDGVDEADQGDHGLQGGDQVPGAVAVARAARHESDGRGQGEQHNGDVEEED